MNAAIISLRLQMGNILDEIEKEAEREINRIYKEEITIK